MTTISQDPLPTWVARLRHPLFIFPLALGITLGAMLVISYVLLSNPINDLQRRLTYVMVVTGIVTTLIAFLFYRVGLLQWLRSLRWTLMLIITFTVSIVLLNVGLMAQLMFIDTYYFSIISIVMGFAGITAVSFSFFAAKAMIDRLQSLSQGADRLAGGDLGTRLQVAGNDEIAQLTQTFNAMAQALQDVDEQKRQLEQTRRDLVAWVSHDLRTPLTSMRVMLEAMADGVITDPETTQQYNQRSLAEIEHLSRLIDDLFEMAQLDVGHLRLDYEKTWISDMVSDTIGSMTAKARKKQLDLRGHVADDVDPVYAAPDKIQRVLYNLVNNAIAYTPDRERITINVTRQGHTVQVDVTNTGVTIAPDILPRLFESFYRGEESRAAGADGQRGTGLGLAIARGFVQAHGGEIWATSSPDHGTTFSFTLPDQPGAS